jgi:hypothetical protein
VPRRTDIFGTWLLAPIPNRQTSGPQPMIELLTPAGERAVAAYDPFRDDPTFRCDPVAVRRVWGAPSTPLSITREAQRVILRHEWMDVVRIVHLDMKDHPAAAPRTSLGHSIGRFEGDTLVVDTTNFTPLTNFRGSPQNTRQDIFATEAMHVVERFKRTGEDTIAYSYTVEDPSTWVAPWSGEIDMRRTEGPIYEYACHEGNLGLANILSAARVAERAAR